MNRLFLSLIKSHGCIYFFKKLPIFKKLNFTKQIVILMIFIQDFDGWTPLHAAAHWAQREACDVLCDNYANMDIKNYVGQTCFDVADPDVLRLLEELKKKQATLQKDRPDLRIYFNRPPVPSSHSGGGGKRR